MVIPVVKKPDEEAQSTSGMELQTGVNVARFAERLAQCGSKSGWLTNFTASKEKKIASEPEKLPSIRSPPFMFVDWINLSSDACKEAFYEFLGEVSSSVSEGERVKTEEQTREQYKCNAWHDMRAQRLTSSHFGDVYKRLATTLPDRLVNTILYSPFIGNEHTRWGKTHEPAARRAYEHNSQKDHPGLKVRKSGLVLHPTLPYLATSPDGIVTCSHCSPQEGLLEVKCPSVLRNKTPEEACSEKTFCCELKNGKVVLKRNHHYFYQVMGQMAVTGKQWCDFTIWTLKGQSVERIEFDEDEWQKMLPTLRHFYTTAIVPEIFTERVKRGLSLY